jgi:hypothetical protein
MAVAMLRPKSMEIVQTLPRYHHFDFSLYAFSRESILANLRGD